VDPNNEAAVVAVSQLDVTALRAVLYEEGGNLTERGRVESIIERAQTALADADMARRGDGLGTDVIDNHVRQLDALERRAADAGVTDVSLARALGDG